MPDFAIQGRIYIDRLKTRNRRPIKPATVAAFQSYLRSHVVPSLGGTEIESFNNGALKAFVQTLIEKKLSPKSIAEISAFTRSIVASVLDADGNQLCPRNWNLDFVDAPPVTGQRQPTITKELIKQAMRVRHARTDKHRVLVALLLASGIRVGELLALRYDDDGEHSGWDQQNSLLAIRTSIWRGVEQKPKTESSIRVVDLCAAMNALLTAYATAANKKPGNYLFATRKGTPLAAHSLHEQALVPLGIPGFHSMRRWRTTWLKQVGTPEALLKFWLGHSSGKDVTARYDKSCGDREWRQATANQVGIGFELPDFNACHPEPQHDLPRSPRKPATAPAPTEPAEIAEPVALAEPAAPHYNAQPEDLDPFFYQGV